MVAPFENLEKFPLEPRDIGGELLAILSRGLYSDARDAIREYAQNGIDAKASRIWIFTNGPRAEVRDDGEGMNWEQVQRARRFGMSDKNAQENVGFRGIGLYSSFGMCDSLEIETHPEGAAEEFTVRFNFGAMREILEQDRAGGVRAGVALSDLLYEYVGFHRERSDNEDSYRGTVVTLEGIDQEYRAQLSDASALGSYLLNTLPAAFPDQEYGPTVNRWLEEHVGIRPVRLSLKVGIEPEMSIQPQIVQDSEPPTLSSPHCDWIRDSNGNNVAFVWYCHSAHRRRLGSRFPEDISGDASGFLLRLKGFTLGDRLSLKQFWPRVGGGALYHHFTGEVHILDDALVFPNAARDGLEPSAARQNLERNIADYFDGLNRRADLSREIKNAGDKMTDLENELDGIKRKFEDEDADPYELYRCCKVHSDKLEYTERQMLRLTRGRKAIRPTPAQKESLENVKSRITDQTKDISVLLKRARNSSEKPSSRRTAGPQHRPQAAVLIRATNALQAMQQSAPDPSIPPAFRAIQAASQARSISRAVAVLDGLKAAGTPLTQEVEESRQELRMSLGWSPTGPVSLKELLEDIGLADESDREKEALIRALDHGLLEASDGRGLRYEMALNAIATELAQEAIGL